MWHEARRSEKKVHDLMDLARKRAQRRALFLATRRGDPQQSLQLLGSRCRLHRDDGIYRATQDHQGLIPWNGKQDVLIDRFDGRALLDFIRERQSGAREKSEEEDELEEFVNFERYRDLIKHRRRGFGDEEGLQHVDQELEAKYAASFASDRSQAAQPAATKGPYSQVGFSYNGDGKDENQSSDNDDDDEDEEEEEDDNDFNSDDSNDEGMDRIAKEFGVKRYGWLVYKDKRAKEEERRQKEVIKGDPSVRKLSRKERRKVSQIGREREREAVRSRSLHHDPYREARRSPTYETYHRSRRSRSRSPSYSSRRRSEDVHRSKASTPKIEYITEFGSSSDAKHAKREGLSPPSSPPSSQADPLSRGQILEALHVDPASGVCLSNEKAPKAIKPLLSSSSSAKQREAEKKETPQERLKRIMNKQLNKQIKKDSAAETAKKREQERQRLEKLAETNRRSARSFPRSRSSSPSSPRARYRHSRSPGRSYRRYDSRSRSRSRSPSSSRIRSRSRY